MDSKLIKLLLSMLLLSVFATTVQAAAGNVDTLCQSISDDLNVAGGCVDDDDLEDTITSAGGLAVLESGDKAGLIILFVAIGLILSISVAAFIKLKNAAK